MNVHRSLSCSLTDYGILYTRANAPAMPMVPSHIDSGLATLRSHLLPPALYAWRGTRDGRGRMLRTEKDKMLAGALYHHGAPEIQAKWEERRDGKGCVSTCRLRWVA